MELKPEKIKVLIAEDDFLIAEEISRILKKIGYQIAGIASNGIKIIEMASGLNPDVVIMDIKMPKMSGMDAAKALIEKGCPAAIIFLTAHESHDLVEEAGKAGVAAYLTKPPKSEDIERAVYIALARQRDLMESRRLIKELEEHKLELAKSNSTKDKFFSILAHDLRNPVHSVNTFSEYLLTHLDEISPKDLQYYLTVVNNTAKGLSGLLEELFLWASIQTNRYAFQPETFQLADVVSTVTNLLLASAVQKEITIKAEINPEITVYADRNMAQTIIRNLISNSIKFTPLNGSIRIEAVENQNEVCISVIDTGVGIYKKDLPKLFQLDHHITTKGTRGEQGSGLGLVLCKEMVEKNRGKIWVESETCKGSKFSFTLPKTKVKG